MIRSELPPSYLSRYVLSAAGRLGVVLCHTCPVCVSRCVISSRSTLAVRCVGEAPPPPAAPLPSCRPFSQRRMSPFPGCGEWLVPDDVSGAIGRLPMMSVEVLVGLTGVPRSLEAGTDRPCTLCGLQQRSGMLGRRGRYWDCCISRHQGVSLVGEPLCKVGRLMENGRRSFWS